MNMKNKNGREGNCPVCGGIASSMDWVVSSTNGHNYYHEDCFFGEYSEKMRKFFEKEKEDRRKQKTRSILNEIKFAFLPWTWKN